MSFKDEIERSFNGLELADNGAVSAEFELSGKSAPFAGHFPGTPVLPGVCLMQCVLTALSKASGKTLSLSAVSKARFSAAVLPGDAILVTGVPKWSETAVSGKFEVSRVPKGARQPERAARLFSTAEIYNV